MGRSVTYLISLVAHTGLAAALTVLPLFSEEPLPEPASAVVDVETLFVLAPPPPPLGRDTIHTRRSAVPRVPAVAQALVPPTVAPDGVDVPIDAALDVAGDAVGIGSESGLSDGVLGGVMGELPTPAPAPPRVVRIGRGLEAPRLVRRVEPAYPAIAAAARLTATVVLEAEVDPRGQVTRVEVERGHPLFDAAAIEAVRQWRYEPLLLNGVPTAFVLTVTIRFELRR